MFSPITSFPSNKGLGVVVVKLKNFTTSEFPDILFPWGDVVSLAGKLAVEAAYPGTRVSWGFGRSSCDVTIASKFDIGIPFPLTIRTYL